ncbi:DUF6933 domain-containing protein [Leptospira jelokensis]|uniref:DUF6933 domain-containing protein n=1 Tax=Leptospira jelokensis TaxID=2484931 RepID=A0A4Z0ZY80_9LEPT|nr:hypothetical protein [Leptospira jelokensis]TGL65095.1 hypothetical protein EHQ62_10925 [Leptospira jelokensis]
MIIRFTKKVQDKFKWKQLKPIAESNLSNEWYVNQFTANRHKYYLATHAESLFSVIFRGVGIKTDGEFMDRMIEAWKNQVTNEGLETVVNNLLVPLTKEILITSTLNRRILGSMSDMIKMTEFILADGDNTEDSSPFALSEFLNKTPFSYIGMDRPKDRIAKYS